MSYINDPRENIQNPETGYVLESENRKEEMYKWSGKILDLCDLPVEEYMKPMTVIALGGGVLPDTGETMYTLKFVIDGVVVGQEKLISGDPIIFNIDAVKEDRNFLGWYYGSTKYEEGALMPSKNLTLTAKYECDVKFIFIVDGIEEEISAYTVDYNTSLNKIPSIDMPGFEFKGWEPSINNPVTSHTVYYATFESIVYVVTWNGYVDGPIMQEYKYNDALIQPINPEKEGYTFKNWDKEIPAVVTSDIQFNAIFDVNKYILSYYVSIDGIEGEAVSSTTLAFASTIPSKKKPIKSGYTFTDWIGYNADTNELFNGDKMPSHNVKYISERTTNQYTVKYFDNNELIHEEKYLYGALITPYVYEKEGWTVSEWSNLPETMPYYDIDVHCTSVVNTYQVIFKDQDGNEYKVQAVYGTPIKDIIPQIEGKTFNVSEDILNSTVGAEDLTIEGEVVVNNYKVKIDGLEGIEIPEELPFGTNVEEYFTLNYPAEEGYHIIVESNHETVPADDSLVVKVTYKPNIWILSYSTTGANDKDLNGSKEVAYNTLILPELPATELEGYDFKGWFNGEIKIDEDDTMPNNNLSATGVYEIMSFVIIVKDGEVEVLNKEYTYGTKLQAVLDDIKEYRDNLYNEGYETIVNIDAEGIIKSTMEFEIERTEREFVLTFMNGETLISSALVKFNSIIEYPEMSGYTENGIEYVFVWEDDSYNGKPMSAHDLTIVGSYQEKAVAPIYYGSFVVPVSAYSEDDITVHISENDIQGAYFQSVPVSECVDNEKLLNFIYPAYEPLAGLTGYKLNQEKNKFYEPLVLLLPIDVVENYNIIFKDGVIGSDCWADMKTDNKIISINGNEYKAFATAGDGYRPFNVEMNYEYKLLINKK